jgi:hypothetical protein
MTAAERERCAAWLDAKGRRLQREADAADPHGPAARKAVANQRTMAESCFNAATLLREDTP